MYRLGSLLYGPRTSPVYAALFNGLRRYGFVEGQNVLADPNGYGLRPEQLAAHASEVVKQRVDVIVCADALDRRPKLAAAIKTARKVGGPLTSALARPTGLLMGLLARADASSHMLPQKLGAKILDLVISIV